jgi:hypothetical protein
MRRGALFGLVLSLLTAATVAATVLPVSPGKLLFNGTFASGGITRWHAHSDGAQCANYGVGSRNYHRRGNLYILRKPVDGLRHVARFDLPPSQLPQYPATICELLHGVPMSLGQTIYYGYMFYVPKRWWTGTTSFWGLETAQYHFENILSAPIAFQLHATHMTLAIATGACDIYAAAHPKCAWRSNADIRSGPNLRPYYVVPPPMRRGVWHEVIMGITWAANSSGEIDAWTRVMGSTAWRQTVHFTGYPTIQWNRLTGSSPAWVTDKVGAYRAQSHVPVSVWLDNITAGTTFAVVASTMP